MTARLFGTAGDVTLDFTERDPDGNISVRVQAHVHMQAGSVISATQERIWLDQAAINRFVRQWEVLDETRNGEARLDSMSPQVLVVKLRPVDRLGHCAAEVELGWRTMSQHWGDFHNSLKFTFDLHADRIAQFREEFAKEVANE